MYRLQIKDKTKTAETAVYYMEEKEDLQEFWSRTEQSAEIVSFLETDAKVGAKQDFSMGKCHLVVHNTNGREIRYYIESLQIKVRWAKEKEDYVKLASFVANGIAKENEYDEGGYEQVVCCGNPVLEHYASEITPLVSDFEDDFKREKITMLCYREMARFDSLEEVNADIAKKEFTDAELELLFRDIPGELG